MDSAQTPIISSWIMPLPCVPFATTFLLFPAIRDIDQYNSEGVGGGEIKQSH